MRSPPLVSAEQVTGVVDSYLDRVADAASWLGVPVPAIPGTVRSTGLAMIDACAAEPDAVEDLLGRWMANLRIDAARSRAPHAGAGAGPVADEPEAGGAPVGTGSEATAAARSLAGLDERSRLALLMRDSYGAPPGAVGVALGITALESRTLVATARLSFLGGATRSSPPGLAGHPVVAGVTPAGLGALADGSADDLQAAVRTLRRHVSGCAVCAAVLEAQTRARVVLAGLPVRPLPESDRGPVRNALLARATGHLPAQAELEATHQERAPAIPGALLAAALVVAAGVGAGIGASLRPANSAPAPTPGVAALPPATGAPSAASPPPRLTASPSPSPTTTATPAVATSVPAKPSRSPSARPSPRRRPGRHRHSPPPASAAPTGVKGFSATPTPPVTPTASNPTEPSPTTPAATDATSTPGPGGP